MRQPTDQEPIHDLSHWLAYFRVEAAMLLEKKSRTGIDQPRQGAIKPGRRLMGMHDIDTQPSKLSRQSHGYWKIETRLSPQAMYRNTLQSKIARPFARFIEAEDLDIEFTAIR
jgi:hypothetical protein